ncbi:alkaline phosphatase-like [Panulirus ornatus]|uniref:alkaline phosphatase-like n=1 Tax=Panulirus ornatus TaxID=150431 RepID=UPI003A87BC47
MSRWKPLSTVVWVTLSLVVTVQTQQFMFEARQHWWDLAQNELAAALNVRDNWNVAKNVILFLGDGMGVTANTAARIYKGQKMGMSGEEGHLIWERFPNVGLLKTYTVDRQVPDSAATATAFLCGVKGNFFTIGVDPAVTLGDCAASRNPIYHTSSILQWAQEAGKDTGIVTTTRVTHATPAATYAHTAHRDWECDSELRQLGIGCKDIADQLVTDNPGRNIKVILGGGRQSFGAGLGPFVNTTCGRADGRDLTQEWLHDKVRNGFSAQYVTTAGEMDSVNPEDTDFLLGLFADSHIPFELERQAGFTGSPSLRDMTLTALRFLKKSSNGYFLLVEGGRIDHGLHDNRPYLALEESVAMDSAVAAALEEVDLEDTLVVVTADHSHVMTINGYPRRGSDILGMTGDLSLIDGLPYTTLMFTNGPGYNYSTDGIRVLRHDPSAMNTRDIAYRSLAAVPTPPILETHGGEDVAIWAAGPMAHLFHRTHEQHYVAHAMAYSACVGPSAGRCERPTHATFTRGPVPHSAPPLPPPPPPSPPDAAAAPLPPSGSALGLESNDAPVAPLAQETLPLAQPKFPTLSPVLQQLLDDNQQKIVTALGTKTVKSFSATSDVRQLLGRSVLMPHSQ